MAGEGGPLDPQPEAKTICTRFRFSSHHNRSSIILVPGVVAVIDTEKSVEQNKKKSTERVAVM